MQGRNREADTESRHAHRGRRGRELNWKIRVDIYTLPHVK